MIARVTAGIVLVVAADVVAADVASAQVAAEVRGRVTSVADGAGIAGARIDDVAGDASTTADATGAFVLHGLTPGPHTIRLSGVGFHATTIAVTVENGRPTTASAALTPIAASLGPVTVSSTRDSALANGTTLTRADIDRSGRADLASLLDQQPGVVVSREGPGGPAHLSIRGSNEDEVLVLVDGVPINSRITGEADLSQLPLATIESITILRGGQSARYGPQALAGVVLITTRRPTGPTVSAEATAGAWDTRGATATLGTDIPGVVSAIVTADRQVSRGDFPYDVTPERGGGTAIRQNDASDRSAITGQLRSSVGPVSLALHGNAVDGSRGLPNSIDAPSFTAHNTDDRVSGGLTAGMDNGPVRWTADVDADRQRDTYRDTTPPIGPPYDDHTVASTIDGTAHGTVGSDRLNFTLGAEARGLHIASTELAAGAPSVEDEDGVWTDLHGALPLGSTTLAADAAVRVDWYSLIPGATASPRLTLSATHGLFAASLSGGQSFNPPTLADQFFHEGVLVAPNPDLKPERVLDEIEARIGVRDIPAGPARLTGDLSVFRANVDGMILWFPNYRFVWSPDNYDVHRAGIEATSQLAIPSIWTTLHASVSDVAVDYAGPALTGQVAYRPRVSGAGGATVDAGPVDVDLSERYIGDRRTVQGSALNSLGAYWLTDLHATVRVVRGAWPIDLLGGVDDLFDRRASLLVDYPYPGRTWMVGLRIHRATSHSNGP
jgi:outer membrane cobalamin receptor